MRLPETVRAELEDRLEERGHGGVASASPVSGGCINHGCRLQTSDGASFFLKWNADAPHGMFAAEVDGLEALRAAASTVDEAWRPVVPEPLETSLPDARVPWLLMSWIPEAPATSDSEARLGRGLALLHRGGRGAGHAPGQSGPTGAEDPVEADGEESRGPDEPSTFGWHRDNWIGSLPQSNRRHDGWGIFWRDERIAPQLELARKGGHLRDPVLDRLVDAVPSALEGVERPELLHGDLWSGNRFVTVGGAAALVDPAVYRGDGEVDLAMSELFGGFRADFYAAYREARGVSPAYGSHRRDLYQLYYLLVHVNLFGSSYAPRTLQAARRVVAAVG